MKKLLQEVMEEIRLTEKRLAKDVKIFGKHSILSYFEKPDIGYRDGDRDSKFDRALAAKEMESKYQAYTDLVVKLAILKEARDRANMTTMLDIEWKGHKYSIYQALLLKRSLAQHIQELYGQIESCKRRQKDANIHYINSSLGGGRKGDVSSEVETFPMLNLKEIDKEAKEFDELLSKIDAKISIANATTEVEIGEIYGNNA